MKFITIALVVQFLIKSRSLQLTCIKNVTLLVDCGRFN